MIHLVFKPRKNTKFISLGSYVYFKLYFGDGTYEILEACSLVNSTACTTQHTHVWK